MEVTYCVYVLKSERNGKRYVGYSSHAPETRLAEHNNGENEFTRLNRPWALLYYELAYCKKCASVRETFLKSGQGRKLVDALELASARG